MIERGTRSPVTESSTEELVQQIVFFGLVPVVLGVILIWTTKKGTNFLIDPPSWLEPWFGRKSFLWSMLGKKGEKFIYYMMGAGGIIIGSLLIFERLVVLAHRFGY